MFVLGLFIILFVFAIQLAKKSNVAGDMRKVEKYAVLVNAVCVFKTTADVPN